MANAHMNAGWHFDGNPFVDIFPEYPKKWRFHRKLRKDIHTLPWGGAGFLEAIHSISRHGTEPVDNPKKNFFIHRLHFFKFSVLHKRSEILLFYRGFDCFWLVNGQPFHEPAEFLACQETSLGSVTGPLKASAAIQSFLEQYKTIPVKMKCFYLPAVPSAEKINGIRIWIKFISVTDNRHEAIKALPHIRSAGYHIDF
jgi:hypothetical protein